MVAMEALAETTSTQLAASTCPERQEEFLAPFEETPQRLTQYSVNWMSLIGRLAGGFSVACAFIRTIAVA